MNYKKQETSEVAPESKQRLLVVSPTFPYPLISGGKQRIYYILRELSHHFRITLLTLSEIDSDEQTYIDALPFLDEVITVPINQKRSAQVWRLIANAPRWLLGMPAEVIVKRSPKLLSNLRLLLSSKQFIAVQIEYAQYAPYLYWAEKAGVPSLLVAHDISFVSQERKTEVMSGFSRLFWSREARLMKKLETHAWSQADCVVAMSKHDEETIKKIEPTASVVVVPNGVDIERLNMIPKDTQPTLVFTGWMRHLPNRDAVEWLLHTIWPLIRQGHSTVCLNIIGKGLPENLRALIDKDHRIKYLGYVNDIAKAVGKATLSLVPLRIGSGTRLKILESMALGTPVVSTSVGYEGISAIPGVHLEVGDTPEEFSAVTVKLLTDRKACETISQAARSLVEKQYAWGTVGQVASQSIHTAIENFQRTTT